MTRSNPQFTCDVTPGLHHCAFYETKKDLLDISVPYVAEGLKSDELCVCVCAGPLEREETLAALGRNVDGLDRYLRERQLEVLDYPGLYTRSGRFHPENALRSWAQKSRDAAERGFTGLRAMGTISWLARNDRDAFLDYEKSVNRRWGDFRGTALCVFPLDHWGPPEIIDLVNNHHSTLMKRGGRWELNQGFMLKRADELLGMAEEQAKKNERKLKISERELQRLTHKMFSIREEEKKVLSACLHSSAGSLAIAAGVRMHSLEERIRRSGLKKAAEDAAETRALILEHVGRIKKIAGDLRPAELEAGSLPEALKEYIATRAKQGKIAMSFSDETAGKNLDERTAIILFRIAEEALNNVIKHSRALTVRARLSASGRKIRLEIRDDGRGFNFREKTEKPGMRLGLRGMREMAESLGGALAVRSAPGRGTRIIATLPAKTNVRFSAH